MGEERGVHIKGGTFAIGLWLYLLCVQACGIEAQLKRIADALEGKDPHPTAVQQWLEKIKPEDEKANDRP